MTSRHPGRKHHAGMIGLRSYLLGAHQFALHPWAVLRAYRELFGPPGDPRVVLAAILHDIGYVLTPDMEGERGERHVELGARLMTRLCDKPGTRRPLLTPWGALHLGPWGRFTLLHSRFYAQKCNLPPSRLCAADKLAITFERAYLTRVCLSGEVREYLACARAGRYGAFVLPAGEGRAAREAWFEQTRERMKLWASRHGPRTTPPPGVAGWDADRADAGWDAKWDARWHAGWDDARLG